MKDLADFGYITTAGVHTSSVSECYATGMTAEAFAQAQWLKSISLQSCGGSMTDPGLLLFLFMVSFLSFRGSHFNPRRFGSHPRGVNTHLKTKRWLHQSRRKDIGRLRIPTQEGYTMILESQNTRYIWFSHPSYDILMKGSIRREEVISITGEEYKGWMATRMNGMA